MDARVSRSTVSGRVRAPPSKSYTHRAILAAGYSADALVRNPLWSADTRATARAVERFGGDVDRDVEADESTLVVAGFDDRPSVPADVIDCANSGTTMRLTTATAGLAPGGTVLTGDASLRSRPQGPLLDALEDLGATAKSTRGTGQAPLVVFGPIDGSHVSIPGDVSSQYVTALLMAGAVTDEGIEIDLTTELKSAPYVDITLDVLSAFGVEAEVIDGDGARAVASDGADGFRVAGGQSYEPEDGRYSVPGDFSSMSYLLAAGAVAAAPGDEVVVAGARPSAQGDAAIVDVLDRMGASIEWDRSGELVRVERSALSGIEVDVGDTPDLLPTIATLGAVADDDTRIVNCEHVRYKETDRVTAMAEELDRLGAAVTEREDVLTIHGTESDLSGATVDGRGDHRLVMALAVAGLAAEGTTTIRGAEHVDVSFPGFFDALSELGATVSLEN
ncbi:MAG: 3-phosphoshikimate 1-carboxyvinyltransferase [Haloferacaceae archaeon]